MTPPPSTSVRARGGPGGRVAWAVVWLPGLAGLAQASYLPGGASLETTPALRFGIGAWPAVAAAIVAHLLYLLAVDAPATAPPGEAVAQRDDARAASTAVAQHPRVRAAV